MKTLLLTGGCFFLVAGFFLLLAALIVFVIARKRARAAANAAPPHDQQMRSQPLDPSPAEPLQPPAVARRSAASPALSTTGHSPAPPPFFQGQASVPPTSGSASGPHPGTDLRGPAAAELTRPSAAHPAALADETVITPLSRSVSHGALHGTAGALEGRIFPLDATGLYIGRDAAMSSVVVPDGRVSKCHVWVGIRDGAATAIDQSSTNGTYLNQLGTRITAESLKPGDTLIISHDVTRLQYRES